MSTQVQSGHGISFFTLLGLLFIALKLLDKIDWPWWIVLAPLWGGVALALVVAVLFGIIAVCVAVVKK